MLTGQVCIAITSFRLTYLISSDGQCSDPCYIAFHICGFKTKQNNTGFYSETKPGPCVVNKIDETGSFYNILI